MTDEQGGGATAATNATATETIHINDLEVPIQRYATPEIFVALKPPLAEPYINAPIDMPPDQIVAFVSQWVPAIFELRADMLKHFEKTKSLKCNYQTGDTAYVFGRPFMLKVYPIERRINKKKAVRGRANVSAAIRPEVSVIDLFLINENDYDQGKAAFLSAAKPIFTRNVTSLIEQCMQRTFADVKMPKSIGIRPLRSSWVHIDKARDTVWVSEKLLPYPPECTVYAFLQQMIDSLHPNADADLQLELLNRGLPEWPVYKAILNDPNSPYANQ